MVRLATIGTSEVTQNMLNAVGKCEEVELAACYSRNLEKAREFGTKYGAKKFYDSLEALAADPEIDAVYVASPNAYHCRQAVPLMKAGKHIFCEKSMATNSEEVALMMKTAKENNVILMEAIRPVHDSGFKVVKENLHKIGKVRGAKIWNGRYSSKYTSFRSGNHENIFAMECSAGGLMDMGVYCVHPMLELFGVPSNIKASCVKVRGGIDGYGTILAEYDDMLAEVSYSKIASGRNMDSELLGEEGVMVISNLLSIREVFIIYNDGTVENLEVEPCDNNMVYELRDFALAVEGKMDISKYQEMSVQAMELMDEARRQLDIVFPGDLK